MAVRVFNDAGNEISSNAPGPLIQLPILVNHSQGRDKNHGYFIKLFATNLYVFFLFQNKMVISLLYF